MLSRHRAQRSQEAELHHKLLQTLNRRRWLWRLLRAQMTRIHQKTRRLQDLWWYCTVRSLEAKLHQRRRSSCLSPGQKEPAATSQPLEEFVVEVPHGAWKHNTCFLLWMSPAKTRPPSAARSARMWMLSTRNAAPQNVPCDSVAEHRVVLSWRTAVPNLPVQHCWEVTCSRTPLLDDMLTVNHAAVGIDISAPLEGRNLLRNTLTRKRHSRNKNLMSGPTQPKLLAEIMSYRKRHNDNRHHPRK